MNPTFDRAGLDLLYDRLFSQADRVVPMRDVAKGDIGHRVIGLRHDVDDHTGSFDTALRMAEWEFDRGISSTYFLLHGARYWGPSMLCRLYLFEELGHEVGVHVNAIGEAFRQRRDPHMILSEALADLRTEVRIVGSVAHGDVEMCYRPDGSVLFINDEVFAECARPDLGDKRRVIERDGWQVQLEPVAREVYGLEYDAQWLHCDRYLSDRHKGWSVPFDEVVDSFGDGQLHVLIHPDWWGAAFERVAA